MTDCRSIPAWLATLALLLNSIGPAGMVLCIGDDGHLAFETTCIEAPEDPACCDPGHHDDEDKSQVADDHCGDCTDHPLLTNPLRPRWGDDAPPPATVSLWLPAVCSGFAAPIAPTLMAASSRGQNHDPPGWPGHGKTIVLRL